MNQLEENSGQQCELPVINALGLHARAAARIAETARAFECRLILQKDQTKAEADSVLEILTLDAPKGSVILARAEGPQAGPALEAMTKLFADRFGEDK